MIASSLNMTLPKDFYINQSQPLRQKGWKFGNKQKEKKKYKVNLKVSYVKQENNEAEKPLASATRV